MRCDRTTPHWSCFGKTHGERRHQAAIPVSLLKEPVPFEQIASDPIEKKSIDLRANRLHEIASEAIARLGVNVEYAHAWIETESSSRKA